MSRIQRTIVAGAAALLLVFAADVQAQRSLLQVDNQDVQVIEGEDGIIYASDEDVVRVFQDWGEYTRSDFFELHGMRCASVAMPNFAGADGSTADCSSSFTNPAAEYAPSVALYRIPVVVHVLQANSGAGFVSDAMIESQIDVLNEDFLAIGGTLGAPGTDVQVEFFLATEDPAGNPTNGITRHVKTKWYNDSGNYANSVGWDTTRYLNIYTNTAGGSLGYAYVPSGGGIAGSSFDGVRILWTAFGRNAPIGAPYNLGRTATHEVGHWMGLYHTFDGGCASASGCASNGDLICDTNPEGSPTPQGTCSKTTCSSPDPTDNYMDYSDDICMNKFTSNQARRMRCTLENFRADVINTGPGNASPTVSINSPANGTHVDDGDSITFSGSASDAEDGNLSSSIAWSSNLDGSLGTGSSVAAVLSVGTHTISAAVEDSGGAAGSDSISVTVDPIGGGGVTLSAVDYKVKGKVRVDLSWGGAAGANVEIYYNGSLLTTTANDGAFTHATGLKGNGTLTYQVCETGGGACSAVIVVNYG